MPCAHCAATATIEHRRRTALGYRTFRCRACRRMFNERTGTLYNHLQYPTDLVLLVVLWRLRYKLSLRDLAKMFLERGFAFTHEAVRECLDHVLVLCEAHLRRVLREYVQYFNHTRPHQGLAQRIPAGAEDGAARTAASSAGVFERAIPILGGVHALRKLGHSPVLSPSLAALPIRV